MRLACFALYAGPDQIMVATSAFATVLGFVLMLWNRLLTMFGKLLNYFRGTTKAEAAPAPNDPRPSA